MKKSLLATTLAVMMIASAAMADGQHGAPGAPGSDAGKPGDDRGHDGGDIIVGNDGVAYIPSTTVTAGVAVTRLTAVRPSGAIAWTATVPNGHLILSGSNLIAQSDTVAASVVTTTLTGISTASGATVWTRTINGRVGSLRPFTGGTYAIVSVASATAGAAPTRSIVGIGNDGSILFTTALP